MKVIKGLVAVLAALVLAGCGSGGCDAGSSPLTGSSACGGETGGGGTTTSATLSIVLSSNTVTAATPATVSATLKTSSGNPIVGAVVAFDTGKGLGTFNTDSALTDDSGVATVTLYPANSTTTGADTVEATTSINGTTVSASKGFQLTSTNVTIASFTSDVGSSQLSAYGQSTLTVTLAGAAPGAAVTVSLASTCVAKNKATLTPASATTTSGTATFTYRDQGCGATDAADAVQASVTGSTANASLNLALTSPTASSITFSSATPATIYLKGSGFSESSQVVFQVKDLAGNVLPNQPVVLEPTTLTGGLTIDGGSVPVTKTSDSSGNVSVLVNSGTVPTPVRIKATLSGSSVTTVSSTLAIAVGLPSQLNFSLSQKTLNIEGYNIDGTTNTYTIIASDRLGNPVPDGTAVSFVAEGSQIQAVGQTTGNPSKGSTTVNFQSSEPRPRNGRVTVLAYALGEESFLDANGNNVYDAGEAFQDLGNLYLNRAFDGVYNPVTDQFISLSISGTSACAGVDPAKDPLTLLSLNKTIPSIAGTCDGSWGRAYVRRAAETVLSTSAARPLWAAVPNGASPSSSCSTVSLIDDTLSQTVFHRVGPGGMFGLPTTGSLTMIAADANPERLNPMAAGTTISVAATTGITATLLGGSPVPSTLSATGTAVSYSFASGTASGTITMSFTSPSGLVTSVPIAVSTAAPTSGCATF